MYSYTQTNSNKILFIRVKCKDKVFPIQTFHDQNVARYHACLVRKLSFFMKVSFKYFAAEPQPVTNRIAA